MRSSPRILIAFLVISAVTLGCADGVMGGGAGDGTADAAATDAASGAIDSRTAVDSGPAIVRIPDSGVVAPMGECLPGLYVGTFEGNVAGMVATGTVSLTLEAVSEGTGEFTTLVIRDGHVEGEANGAPYTADVTGELDCETARLMDGRLENGTYRGFAWSGTTEARYDPIAHAFVEGTWTATAGSAGTWGASHREGAR
jgi:hypothetical protein